MALAKEMVLYYQPDEKKQGGNGGKGAKVKGVLVRMGIRIRNITANQLYETIGYLAGVKGYEASGRKETVNLEPIGEEVLVMKNFTDRRLDEFLSELRRAGIPKIALKAVVTDTNCNWTFYELYEELKKEHEAMEKKREDG